MDAPPLVDATAFKAATRAQWDRCAAGWNAKSSMIRTWLRGPTDAMLQLAGVNAGARVLDVAAGAGDQTLDIADRVGSNGSVLATDISPAILAFVSDNASRHGFKNVATRVADGESLGLPEGSFDAAVCRLGLMFFPEPLHGLREMHRALKPGGKACTMVFSAPERNPCVTILVSTAMKHAGLPLRDPYQPGGPLSLGKPGLIEKLFDAAGFKGVETTIVAARFRLPSVADYLDFVRTSASPIIDILSRLDAAAQRSAWQEIEMKLRAFDTGEGWEGPNELLLTVGHR